MNGLAHATSHVWRDFGCLTTPASIPLRGVFPVPETSMQKAEFGGLYASVHTTITTT